MSETTAPAVLELENLRRTVADVLDVEETELTDEADFVNDLGVDSLMALEVMVVLEKKYGVKLGESELKEVTCLRKAYDLLDAKLTAA
ncbi:MULTISPECIES: acyl carrier protein [Streptomyces]|uniref:Polyketide-8 synthase acyl carrier protein n=1 Tax=Streptomyces katrae TaxID=68223 RepID=A0A0F4JBR6_9ACTN|nr:acyl carrier protein [Streptomyces katrae]KJY31183.1 polyketide-8 synthase acyl carrier protein [Streptomyces katrae]